MSFYSSNVTVSTVRTVSTETSAMPRCLLSSRYNFESVKKNNGMADSLAKSLKGSKISDPLIRQANSSRKKRNSKEFGGREQSLMLQSNHWLRSDLVPFTIRYELELRHNIELMAHYGEKVLDEDEENIIVMSEGHSTENEDQDEDDEIEYFVPKPRRIDFDVLENASSQLSCQTSNVDINEESDDKKENVVKKKRNKTLSDATNKELKKFTCDVCKKLFEKRWALNSHMLLHSGDKPFRCNYKTCTKQYADRSNLRAHQRSKKHHSWKLFCHQCTKPFSEQRYLNLHSLSACRKYLASINKKT